MLCHATLRMAWPHTGARPVVALEAAVDDLGPGRTRRSGRWWGGWRRRRRMVHDPAPTSPAATMSLVNTSSSVRRRRPSVFTRASRGGDSRDHSVEQLVVGGTRHREREVEPSDGQAALDELPFDRLDRARMVGQVDQLDLDAAERTGEFGHRALRDESAGVERHDVVADPFDLFEHVRRQHHVDPELAVDVDDDAQHLVALDRVESVGRFVEHDQARVGGDRLGELDPLALSGRHRAECPEAFFAETDEIQRVAGAGAGLVVREATDLGEVADEVVGLHVVGQHVAFGPVADHRPQARARRPSGRGRAR